MAKENDLVATQLAACVRQADLPSLRRLRPEMLPFFLLNAHQLNLLDGRPGLWAMANPLLPPSQRAQLLLNFVETDHSDQNLVANVARLRQATALAPDFVPALSRLAWILATTSNDTVRNGRDALALASHAQELDKNKNLGVIDTLACAYAESGDFNRAVDLELQAIAMAQISQAKNTADIVALLNSRLALFQQKKPYRE